MAVDAARAKSLFLTASELADPAERAAYLERECGGDAALRPGRGTARRRRGRRTILEDDPLRDVEPTSPATLEATAASRAETRLPSELATAEDRSDGADFTLAARSAGRSPRRIRRGPGHRRPVHAARGPRRGGDGHRLPGRSDPTGQAAGGAQADQGRHGLARGAGAVRRRAASPGPDGPPQHRPRLRRRQHRGRPAVLRDGAGERGADHRVLRPQAASGPGPAGVVRGGLPGRATRPPEGDHPPRPQAQQCHGHRGRRPATPKVIDFGVAKATEFSLTDQSLADTGAIVGTPTYMSPEQADPSSMDIDTRTDVYALGVILYELLAGSPPIDAKQFKRGAILEMLRMVREVDPPRPSTRVSTADALPSIAASRDVEPAHLKRALQGDLDWIVMMALEKDRTRRYETANGFAADIQRHLAHLHLLGSVYVLLGFL